LQKFSHLTNPEKDRAMLNVYGEQAVNGRWGLAKPDRLPQIDGIINSERR
jgi:hypothetical protein